MYNIEDYAKQIAEQLNNARFVNIENRPLSKEDISNLTNNQIIKIKHKKGFDISIRKKYVIEYVLNIPTLMYSLDKYMVADDLLGVHPLEYELKDTVQYVNGLLGYLNN